MLLLDNWIAEIEARFSSVPASKARQPGAGKGNAAEVVEVCLRFIRWAVGKYPPDCHMYLWSAVNGCSVGIVPV